MRLIALTRFVVGVIDICVLGSKCCAILFIAFCWVWIARLPSHDLFTSFLSDSMQLAYSKSFSNHLLANTITQKIMDSRDKSKKRVGDALSAHSCYSMFIRRFASCSTLAIYASKLVCLTSFPRERT